MSDLRDIVRDTQSFEDGADLVRLRVKLAELASWLSRRPVFERLAERDTAQLSALLFYVADVVIAASMSPFKARLTATVNDGAQLADDLYRLGRSASYDAYLPDTDDELATVEEATTKWRELVAILEELDRSRLLGSRP